MIFCSTRLFLKKKGRNCRLMLLSLLLPVLLAGQNHSDYPAKLSPRLTPEMLAGSQTGRFVLAVTNLDSFRRWLESVQLPVAFIREYPLAGLVLVETSAETIGGPLADSPLVRFIDWRGEAAYPETPTNGLDLRPNRVNLAHHVFPQFNGQGLTASLKESALDAADIDFRLRYLLNPELASQPTVHAGFMATILGGGGNSHRSGKGAAWGCRLTAADFDVLLPEADEYYDNFEVSVENHSYGIGIEPYYGAEAVAYDAATWERPELLQVFSSGNQGLAAPATGPYAGLPGFCNLTGTFKMAQNVLVVGATDVQGNIDPFSSAGPTYDGRIKPELVAYGRDGTSGAAALVSGTALLLQQAYRESHAGLLPPAALVKALLINGADEVGAPGPSYLSGFGSLNAYRSLQTLENGWHASEEIQNGQEWLWPVTIPPNAASFKATLTWTVPPNVPNAPQALTRDLELRLINASSGETWLPWVLSTFPSPDSLNQPARRGSDHFNNVEQISINLPEPGQYELVVYPHSLPAGDTQEFSLAFSWDTTGYFQWAFPTGSDALAAGEPNILRWETSLDSTTASLSYSIDGGLQWLSISDSVSLQPSLFEWIPPDTLVSALLRLESGGKVWLSDTFPLSPEIRLSLGFNCPDTLMFHWNQVSGAAGYSFYALDGKFLSPLPPLFPDTLALFPKALFPYSHFAVAPLLPDGRPGLKSYSLNYAENPVGCYFESLLADLLEEGQVALQLRLGTNYQIAAVRLEKIFPEGRRLAEWPGAGVFFTATDETPEQGLNRYQAQLQLEDGRILLSEPADVYYWGEQEAFVFPNPAEAGQDARLLARTVGTNTSFVLHNALGQEVFRLPVIEGLSTFQLPQLAPGTYFFRLMDKGSTLGHGKLVVRK